MSEENVELVLALLGDPDRDLVPLVRDDAIWTAASQAWAPVLRLAALHAPWRSVLQSLIVQLAASRGAFLRRSPGGPRIILQDG